MRKVLARLQPLGRALMLPIAVLPVAGLLLRLGQPDLLNQPFIAAAGTAIFANLGLLFAIGVAVGLARENNGAAGLAGAVAYLVTIEGAKALLHPPLGLAHDPATADALTEAWRAKELAKLIVPVGIVSGVTSGLLYNRYATIKVPEYLAFFGGRRFVPIAAGGAGVAFAAMFGLGYPWLAGAIDVFSHWTVGAGALGLFLYGVLNRLLLVTGLHHILNNVLWFIVGDYHGTTGDLHRFFAGDPTAGAFMSGFFPVMMFGLPAACFAMYRTALPEKRAQVGGMLLSMAATSFLTGVTEPIEFTFIFLAPLLFVIHAVLTGLSMVIMHALHVRLGFGFSAGLFDYVLNYKLDQNPLLLIPVGLGYSAIYYAVFRYCILRFDLATPGRRADEAAATAAKYLQAGSEAESYVMALGGPGNLLTVDACTTRLRLTLADPALADEASLKQIGARGVVRPGGAALQVVIGPQADALASEIRAALPAMHAANPGEAIPALADALRAAIGGGGNLADVLSRDKRICITPKDGSLVNMDAIGALVPRGASRGLRDIHILVGKEAPHLAKALGHFTK